MPNSSQKNTSWDDFFLNVEVPIDFMDEREQPKCQTRHSLGDDTFPIIYFHKDFIASNKPANQSVHRDCSCRALTDKS